MSSLDGNAAVTDSRRRSERGRGAGARARPARARARPPARAGRLGMTRRRRSAGGSRRKRKRRARSQGSSGRAARSSRCSSALPVVILVAGTVGATAVFGSSCDLNALQPVAVGQNSFVYAANGSELGVIPAERNRTPVSRGQISHWLPEGDGRDRGPALLPARRRRPRRHRARRRRRRPRGQVRAGRLDDHAGARAEPLPLARADAEAEAHRGVSRDQARAAVVEGHGS